MIWNDIRKFAMTLNDVKTTCLRANNIFKSEFELILKIFKHQGKWHTHTKFFITTYDFERNTFKRILKKWACVTSPSPGNQVDGLPGGVSTGAVVASWHPGRRATIHIFDMKNKGFDENCKWMLANISIFHLVWYVSANFMQIFKWNGKSLEEIYFGRKFQNLVNLVSNL